MAFPLGHIATGLGVSMVCNQTYDPLKQRMLTLKVAGLSLLPDIDYLLVWPLGLSYEVYHRGFSHSVLFAIMAGLVFAILEQRKESGPLLWRSAFYILIILSHDVLDLAMTDDRFEFIPGLMLAWPWSSTRFAMSSSPLTDVYIHAGPIMQMTPLYFLWHCTRNTLIEAAVFVPPVLLIWSLRIFLVRHRGIKTAR